MIDYTTHQDDLNRIIKVVIAGPIEIDETRAMGLKVRTLAKEKGYGILFDYRKADPSKIRLLDVDLTFKEVYDKHDVHLRAIPVVILHIPAHNQMAKFLELSWKGENINTKVTTNEDLGFSWLKSELKKSA